MKTSIKFLSRTFIVFAMMLFYEHVYAITYTATPLVIDVQAEARDILTRKITVSNIGEQPITIYPTVNNVSLKEGETIEEFHPPVESDRTQSLASWIEISRRGIDLQPGTTHDFSLTLRINPDPVPGTYHAFIGFGQGRNRDDAERQVKNGDAPGTIVTVTIREKQNDFLRLSKFIVERFITKPENQAAVFTFINPGDETLTPSGEIIIYDSKGSEVGVIKVNDENLAIPSGEEHTFTATVPTNGMFGKYKAFLSIEYGTSQRGALQDTSFFYVFPLKIILIIVSILLCIVAFSAWYFHKKYFDEKDDDSDRLTFHIRDSKSESKEHDVILKQK